MKEGLRENVWDFNSILYFSMAVWAVKRDDGNETNERLIKRWKRQVNGARVMNSIRSKRYQKQAPTKRLVREAAIKRSEYQDENKKNAFYA